MHSNSNDQVGAHAVFSCLVELQRGEIREVECMVWVTAEYDGDSTLGPLGLHLHADGQDGHLVYQAMLERVMEHILHLDHPKSSIRNGDYGQRMGTSHLGTVCQRTGADPRLALREAIAFMLEAAGTGIQCHHFELTPPHDQTRPPQVRCNVDPRGLRRSRRMFRRQESHGGAHI